MRAPTPYLHCAFSNRLKTVDKKKLIWLSIISVEIINGDEPRTPAKGPGEKNQGRQMDKISKKIGFIGAGNMAWAVIGALINTGAIEPGEVIAADIDQDRLELVKNEFGIAVTSDGAEAFSFSDVIVLAVKPQIMPQVLGSLAGDPAFPGKGRKLIISIAAGITIAGIESALYKGLEESEKSRIPIVRVMPNTPALVGKGMSGMAKNPAASNEDVALAEMILAAAGKTRWFDEQDINSVTALSGSGPAYVFYLAEAMINGGKAVGLSEDDSRALAVQTILGAAELMEKTGEHPAELRKKVTSKGGTTAAALKVFDDKNVKRAIEEGMIAAKKRGDELAGG